MKTGARRLRRVEAALTPRQQVLRWLDGIRAAGSLHAYCQTVLGQSVLDWPGEALTTAARKAARRRTRKAPPEAIEAAERDAARDVLFLLHLAAGVNADVRQQARETALKVALASRGLQVAVLRAAGHGCRGGNGDRPPHLAGVRADIAGVVGEVAALRQAVALVSRRYFAGQPILFPEAESALERVSKDAARLVGVFDATPDGGIPPIGKAVAADSTDADDPTLARLWVADAKAQAALQVGQREVAVGLLRNSDPGVVS